MGYLQRTRNAPSELLRAALNSPLPNISLGDSGGLFKRAHQHAVLQLLFQAASVKEPPPLSHFDWESQYTLYPSGITHPYSPRPPLPSRKPKYSNTVRSGSCNNSPALVPTGCHYQQHLLRLHFVGLTESISHS